MALIVQKFGGSSVGSLERIQQVAAKVLRAKQAGHDVVVVVSAMYGETDRLIQMAQSLANEPNPREYDMLVSTGEQVSVALLAIALENQDCRARSFTGAQAGIQTDNVHTKARILDIKTDAIRKELANGSVVIVAGFQGINQQGDVTTLGRGGSDTTAVALAAALKADECQIYTDVDGVYTTDPHVIPEARLLPQISFAEMLAMASLGAKVLQMRSVELASKHNLPVRVLSTFNDSPGTLVTFEDKIPEKRAVSGIAFSREEAIINLAGIPNTTNMADQIQAIVNAANIEIDMIAQNSINTTHADFTFTVQRKDCSKTLQLMQKFTTDVGAGSIKSSQNVAKLSLVGLGMRSHNGVASKLYKTLDETNINIQMITTSDIKISVMVDEDCLERGVKAVHQAFELDKTLTDKQSTQLATE